MSIPILQHRQLPIASPICVLACGAWLKNTACLLDGDTVWYSPLHGDLGEPNNRIALVDSLARLQEKATKPIQVVAHDLHPDFFSTEMALQIARRLSISAIGVQHHHAHIALIQAEKGIDTPLIGLALDGIGLGTDQTAWGGELLWVDGANFERIAHLPALQLPGGDVAAREPWRMAAAVLHRLGRSHEISERLLKYSANLNGKLVGASKELSENLVKQVQQMLERKLNCPITTSAGRWFDAVAGLLGICLWQTEEAQAAIALETLATEWLSHHPAPVIDEELMAAGMNLDALMNHLLLLIDQATDINYQGECAAVFHIALAHALARQAIQVANDRKLKVVALGGGCFYNSLLRQQVSQLLLDARLEVLLPEGLNVGDAGLALGQAWVAAKMFHEERMDHSYLHKGILCA